jgi:type I restriction enzyme S subunit
VAKPKTKPDIRYKEFTGDWERRKLGDVAVIIMGQSPNSTNYTDNSADHILVQGNADMKNGRVTPRVWTTQVTKKAEKGDLILSVRAPVGDVGKTDFPVVLGRGVAAIRGNEFLLQTLLRMKQNRNWNKLSAGSTFDSINSNDIKESIVMVPMADEQNRIGDILESLDHLITLQQREHNKTVNIKKAMLEKMFPKEGAVRPEIRFAGFTDAWEQRRAVELCSISTGKSNTQDRIDEGEYPFYVRSPIIERSSKYLYDEEAVLTVGDGVGTGKVYHYVNGKYDLHQRVYRMFDFNSGVSAKYFYWFFSNHFYERVMRMTAKTSVDSVRLEMIADMKIIFPSEGEQHKITALFDDLDHLITLHHRELVKLQNIKKALLGKMFV